MNTKIRCTLMLFVLACPLYAQRQMLTLDQAEQMAIKNNPQITTAKLLAKAQAQVTREAFSAELPTLTANLTAVTANNGSRITAGGLNNPVLYERAAAGITASQLITDFGRTQNLVRSADFRAKAALNNQRATEAEITLAVDEAFFRSLAAQSVMRVADQTVKTRQTIVDRISALTQAKLRSTLDESFANVALSQAKLLSLDAKNDFASSLNRLNALLGQEAPVAFDLVDPATDAPALPPADAEPLVAQAFLARPEILSAMEREQAAKALSTAEHRAMLPTISALGSAGSTPVRADQINGNWYGAVGVNMSIPIFNGFLNSARANEAELRHQAASQQVLRVRQTIARDVRQTVLQAQNSFSRISVSKELLDQGRTALDLAQTRYDLGIASVVELSQAQLAETQAEIGYASARFSYQELLAQIRFQTGR